MKTLLFAAAAAAALAVAAPALAQSYAPTPPTTAAMPGHDIRGQLDALRQRVQDGFTQGQLGQGETNRLYREIDRIRAVEQSDRQSDGSLREHDRMDLQSRIDAVSRSIHWQRAEGGAASPPVAVVVTETAPPPPVVVTETETVAVPVGGVWTLDQRENWLQGRIDHAADEHRLSGNEIARGQQELGAIRAQQAHLLSQDGGTLSEPDRSYLVHRLNELNETLRWEGRNPPPPWGAGA